MASKSPLRKRVRLDPSASPSPPPVSDAKRAEGLGDLQRHNATSPLLEDVERKSGHNEHLDGEESEDHCVICLHHIRDRTVLPCAHDRLCFDCIFVWCQQSRKCPLCNAPIGPFLIHNFRSKYDYSKYYLPPLRTSSPASGPGPQPLLGVAPGATTRRTRMQSNRWGSRRRNRSGSRERRDSADALELAIERRRWVYRHGLYAKHVASNPYTRYRPAPTPTQIAASPDLISRATIFVRRELRVWVNLDVEFLTTFILSLMKTLDLRSESAVKLLAEFLDMNTPYYIGDTEGPITGRFANAERFSHELYSYLRSPFRDLAAYDATVQYDVPPHISPLPLREPVERDQHWNVHSSIRGAPSPHRSLEPSSPCRRSGLQRDPYFRSPSPTRHNPPGARSRRQSPRPRSTADLHGFTNHNDGGTRDSYVSSSDIKGKRKFPPASKDEALGDDHRLQDPHSSDTPRRKQDCARRSAVAGTHLHPPSIPRDSPHDISRTSGMVTQDRTSSDRPDSSSKSLAPESTTSANRREPVTGDITREESTSLLKDSQEDHRQADDRSETAISSWGISIKGQAKRLSQHRQPTPPESSGSYRESRLVAAESMKSRVPKKRSLNPLSLDILHAHLGDSSPRQHKKGVNLNGMKDVNPGEPPEATIEHSDQTLPLNSESESQHGTSSGKSARDIMARTRAKLAKLREVAPYSLVVDPISDTTSSPVTGEITSVPPSTDGLRSRLLERLEEEKRQAIGQSSSQAEQQPTSDLPNDETQALDVDDQQNKSSNGSSKPNRISTQAQQAEIKLRAQALLRVRLAAEKRRVDVSLEQGSMGTSEEALRASLLSRRNIV